MLASSWGVLVSLVSSVGATDLSSLTSSSSLYVIPCFNSSDADGDAIFSLSASLDLSVLSVFELGSMGWVASTISFYY